MPERRRWRLVRRVSNVVLAMGAAAAVLVLCASGFGALPALGPALDPGRGAWAAAIAHLAAKLGASPPGWAWGRLHSRQFPSLAQVAALGYGPRPAGGDPWTVDAADGLPVATQGPSWRMIVRWAGHGGRAAGGGQACGSGGGTRAVQGRVIAEGIYPGGQSESPASPWYQNLITDWWDGRYLPMPPAGAATAGQVRWELRP